MTDQLIAAISGARTVRSAGNAVERLLTAPTREEVLDRVIRTSRKVDNYTLEYFVLPRLKAKARKDTVLLSRVQDLVGRRGVPINLRLHCIELVDTLVRERNPSYPRPFVDFVVRNVTDPAIPTIIRARLARMLTRVGGSTQLDALRLLLDSNVPELVEAACHPMSSWSQKKLNKHKDLVSRILRFVRRSPKAALKCSNLLRTFARSGERQAFIGLDNVLSQAKTEEEWSRLVACVGPSCLPRQLARIIGGATVRMGPTATIAIRNLLRKQPSLLEVLYRKGYWKEFLYGIAVVPEAIGRAALPYLKTIRCHSDLRIAKIATGLTHELTVAKRYHLLAEGPYTDWQPAPGPAIVPTRKRKIRDAYSTGFQMGDALYRHAYVKEPNQHNHWHTAVFQTFQFLPGGANGQMHGMHVTNWPGEGTEFFAASRAFHDANCDVATEMKELRSAFLTSFEVDGDHPYHGARCTPIMTKEDRLNIWSVSADLMYRNIWWTGANMLDWKGSDWSGESSDIDNLRCDGVVEFAYEKCGKKVCEGEKPSKWNIAAAGKAHPKSHNNFHTGELDKGELCPKVQGGGVAYRDTTFVVPPPSVPAVHEFAVHEEAALAGSDIQTKSVIAIRLNVLSSEYDHVYVRIVVGPPGGPFQFVSTGASGFPWSIAGEWKFKEIAQGMSHIAYWAGDTYFGQNGDYEFRVVAVDRGGNVSREYAFTITIDWSHILPPPW